MGDALEAFMRTGDPNTGKKGGLPHWPRYTQEEGATMILNNVSRVENDPDRAARALME